MKLKLIIIGLITFGSCTALISQPLIMPDTVYIDPAYYNSEVQKGNGAAIFEVKINKPEGVEILSLYNELNYSEDNPDDKTSINVVPGFYHFKNGNIVLEDNSSIALEAICNFNNPDKDQYETNLLVSYKTSEGDLAVDTVVVIANRVEREVFTSSQILNRDYCEGIGNKTTPYSFVTSIINGSSDNLIIDSLVVRTNQEYKLEGYAVGTDDRDFSKDYEFPYILEDEYFKVKVDFGRTNVKLDDAFIDFYTSEGKFTDTMKVAYSNKKGIIAKSWYQELISLDYESITSKKNAFRMCSEKGYRINEVRLEGQIYSSEIELTEFYKIGDILTEDYVELSQFTISPERIYKQRTGKYVYELENMATGNVLEVEFPFSLGIDFAASVYNNLPQGYSVYPNPSNGIINVKGSEKIKRLELVDLLGNYVQSIQNASSLNVESVESGVYFLKIVEPNSIKLEKVIIE